MLLVKVDISMRGLKENRKLVFARKSLISAAHVSSARSGQMLKKAKDNEAALTIWPLFGQVKRHH